jgi:sec-independent protein translocase protein TatC
MPPIRARAKSREILREMSFLEHLDELRGVLIHSLLAFMAASIVLWFFSGTVLDFIVSDIPVDKLNFFSPAEAFMARLKMSFVLGAMVTFPFILFKVWRFVSPGLFDNERGRVYPFVVTSSVLFYAGVLFCYTVLIPIVMDFLLGFGTERLSPLISISAYFAFVARMCFTFGLVFQLPVVVLLLSLLGIVTPQMLLRQWRWAVVIIFTVAAVLTPPDPASQVLMALPVLILYLGSVVVARIAVGRRNRDDEEEQDEEEDR